MKAPQKQVGCSGNGGRTDRDYEDKGGAHWHPYPSLIHARYARRAWRSCTGSSFRCRLRSFHWSGMTVTW